MITLSVLSLLLAAIPAVLFLRNLRLYTSPVPARTSCVPRVSVLIPARNEARNIEAAVRCCLRNVGVNLEVVVADDASEDGTADIVRRLAGVDPRVRLIESPPLPPGWNGKQHACHVLAQAATMPLLCFVDADVRLEPAALATMAAFLQQSGSSLVSGVPRQITMTWMERLLIPLVHFILLGFLPIERMRASVDPAYAAGCGQLFLAIRQDYHAVGGHASIRRTLHDGIKLPGAFRSAGFKTDLLDATRLARCRMYHNAGEVWSGLAKNATEGMASPGRLPVFTLLLMGGQVLPFLLVLWGSLKGHYVGSAIAGCACILALLPRLLALRRFQQPLQSAVFHPVGILLLLAIQWSALARKILGKQTAWRGRNCQLQSTG